MASLKIESLLLIACAIALSAAFFLCLHPISGMLGGLVFTAAGWAIPTLVNLQLSLAAAWFFRRRLHQVVVFVVCSLLLGINTSFISLISAFSGRPQIVEEIRKPIVLKNPTAVPLAAQPLGPLVVNPLGPSVMVGSDAGCACMYFLPNADAVMETYLIRDLSERLGTTIWQRSVKHVGPFFEIRSVAGYSSSDRRDVVVTVFDGKETAAMFAIVGLPDTSASLAERTGRQKGLDNGYFLENSLDLLLHDNIWSGLLGRAAVRTLYPRQRFAAFLNRAVSVSP